MATWMLLLICALLTNTVHGQADRAKAAPAKGEVLSEPVPAAGYWLPKGTRVDVVSRQEVVFHLPQGQVLTRYDGQPVLGRYTRLRLLGQCSAGRAGGCVIYRLNGEYSVMPAGCPGGCETIVTPLK